jgi:hypothetical protein
MVKTRIDLVKLLPQNSKAAEVGVAEGFFSADLLRAGVGILYSIDAWKTIPGQKGDGGFDQSWHDKNYVAAVERLKEFRDRSIIIRGMSVEAANGIPDESLDLVYLDDDHSVEGVISSLTAYYPKIKPGGIMAGHDYMNDDYGVKIAVNRFVMKEMMNGSNINIEIIPENSMWDASFYFYKPS